MHHLQKLVGHHNRRAILFPVSVHELIQSIHLHKVFLTWASFWGSTHGLRFARDKSGEACKVLCPDKDLPKDLIINHVFRLEPLQYPMGILLKHFYSGPSGALGHWRRQDRGLGWLEHQVIRHSISWPSTVNPSLWNSFHLETFRKRAQSWQAQNLLRWNMWAICSLNHWLLILGLGQL